MIKSIILIISMLIFFSGCHRVHPFVTAAVIIPAVIVSPFVHRPYYNGYYRGHRGDRGGHGHRRGYRR